MKYLLGIKRSMTQVYDDKGFHTPVTVLRVGPCVVTQVKTVGHDGYNAVQIGCGEKKRGSRALRGHLKNLVKESGAQVFAHLKEARLESVDGIERGDLLDLSSFAAGDHVDVVGTSKGKGFAGVVKRHHFHGHPPSHGHKDQERMPGSIGAGGNQHVFKGVRMAGRMGGERVTVKDLVVIKVDASLGELWLNGALPGSPNSLVIVTGAGEMKFKKAEKSESKSEENIGPQAKETDTSLDAGTQKADESPAQSVA